MRRLLLLASLPLLALVACKTTETAAKPVEAAPAAPAPAPEPTPPPTPKVELPPAPPLPALPSGLPPVPASAENPLTPEKAELGWKLFFDPRLSKDGTMACAGCHQPERAYTTANALDAKVGGAMNKRNSPSVLNLAYHPAWYWDGRAATLEAVSAAAWKGQLGADPAAVAAALNEVPVYKALFERAFGEPATADNVPRALASFFRALLSGGSAWDRAQAGEKGALAPDAAEGFKVFSARGCAGCHAPPLFSTWEFESAGLGDDPGRKDATKADADLGRFKVPSLRNVALTAPYFHDGSGATLDEAVALMAKGGGAHPSRSPRLKPQRLSAKEARQLKLFLEALTGAPTYPTAPALP